MSRPAGDTPEVAPALRRPRRRGAGPEAADRHRTRQRRARTSSAAGARRLAQGAEHVARHAAQAARQCRSSDSAATPRRTAAPHRTAEPAEGEAADRGERPRTQRGGSPAAAHAGTAPATAAPSPPGRAAGTPRRQARRQGGPRGDRGEQGRRRRRRPSRARSSAASRRRPARAGRSTSVTTPNGPMSDCFMTRSASSGGLPLPRPSAVSARPSRCSPRVSTAGTATAPAAASSGAGAERHSSPPQAAAGQPDDGPDQRRGEHPAACGGPVPPGDPHRAATVSVPKANRRASGRGCGGKSRRSPREATGRVARRRPAARTRTRHAGTALAPVAACRTAPRSTAGAGAGRRSRRRLAGEEGQDQRHARQVLVSGQVGQADDLHHHRQTIVRDRPPRPVAQRHVDAEGDDRRGRAGVADQEVARRQPERPAGRPRGRSGRSRCPARVASRATPRVRRRPHRGLRDAEDDHDLEEQAPHRQRGVGQEERQRGAQQRLPPGQARRRRRRAVPPSRWCRGRAGAAAGRGCPRRRRGSAAAPAARGPAAAAARRRASRAHSANSPGCTRRPRARALSAVAARRRLSGEGRRGRRDRGSPRRGRPARPIRGSSLDLPKST